MQEKFLDRHFLGGITKPVQSLLQIFLFFQFLKTVTTLQCEVCFDMGSNCTGSLKTCEPEQETCVIILIYNSLGGVGFQTVAKGCESIVVCDAPKTHLNMGNEKFLQADLVCCTDDACKTATPSLPSVETNANGRQCPACFSDTGTCEKELANCTGDEHYCFHLFMRSYGDGVLWDSIMEGCTTKSTCNQINHGYMYAVQRRNTGAIPRTSEDSSPEDRSLRSDKMQGLLQLFFCFILLAKASCLQCETCESNSTSCTGPKENCTEGETCVIAIVESKLERGVTQHEFMKSCGNPTACDSPQLHFDLGNGQTYHLQNYCCKDEDCSKITPTLPPIEKDPKGKRCPACNKIGEPCKKDLVQCSGKDSDCFTLITTITSGGEHINRTMKGCGSKNICDMFGNEKQFLAEDEESKGAIKCTYSGASQILASFLTTFYSLWILKLLV
ncbi:uncharacterized protein LOC131204559 [Ahaetulla prasina]|uniref:uncharacterized protein LOC131204559 n=1 Tax=Ahaetulla prasina TaxID=499056 RepID=UPI00264A103C|nr:uncharacterized protein LOC131204559 [Ahaetulla prasina]